MPNEAAANPVSHETVSDSVHPSTDLNNPSNWDFDDEPETANAAPQTEGTDQQPEPDESEQEAAQEADESEQATEETETEGEAEAETPAPVEVNVPDDALVTLANGEKVKFADLKKAPMFEKDYRHKTQELGNQRRAMAEQATRIQNVTEAFVTFLAEQIPAEPTPQLALQDPQEFVRQKAFYDAAVARVQALIEQGTQVKAVNDQLSQEQKAEAMRAANEALEERLPFIREPAKRQEFNQATWDTARHFGFTPEELGSTTDYRLLWMGHYAAKGLKAEMAEKKVAQKVQQAPQTTPAKKAVSKGNPQFLRNKEAMRRLSKTGSIQDAMAIDFE